MKAIAKRTSLPSRRRRTLVTGFTLVELLVVVAIIALLLGILIPSLSRAREVARTTQCKSNLKQWGTAMNIYAAEHRDLLPADGGRNPAGDDRSWVWYNALPPVVNQFPYGEAFPEGGSELSDKAPDEKRDIWFCPTELTRVDPDVSAGGNLFHYATNGILNGERGFGGSNRGDVDCGEDGSGGGDWTYRPAVTDTSEPEPGVQISDIRGTSSAVYMAEPQFRVSSVGPRNIDRERHLTQKTNILFLDTHTETVDGCGAGEYDQPEFGDHRSLDGQLRWGVFVEP